MKILSKIPRKMIFRNEHSKSNIYLFIQSTVQIGAKLSQQDFNFSSIPEVVHPALRISQMSQQVMNSDSFIKNILENE